MTKNSSELIRDWPEKPQEVARKTIETYGQPDEATSSSSLTTVCRPRSSTNWHDMVAA